MKIAIIGTGSIAEDHATAIHVLRESPEWSDVRLAAAVGRDLPAADAFARAYGFDRALNPSAMLADDTIDVVIVTTPTDLHAEHTRQALAAGKHVLCEIPLATSLAEVDDLIALADRVDRRLMVCQTQRYFRPLIEARRRIEAGEISVRAIVSRYLFHRRNRINWKGKERTWTDNLLWHHACHSVDATMWLLGASEVEVAGQIADPDLEMGIPMDLAVVLRTPSGQIATVANSYSAIIPQHDYLIIGEETSLHFVGGALRSPEGELVPATGSDPLPDAVPRQNADFLSSIRDGVEPPVSARSVRPAMAVLQQIADSRRP